MIMEPFLEDFNGASGWEITISLNEALKRAVRETAATKKLQKKFFLTVTVRKAYSIVQDEKGKVSYIGKNTF